MPLEIEHFTPRSRGGTDRVSNLTVACHRCNNVEKGSLLPDEWIAALRASKRKADYQKAQRVEEIKKELKKPLKDAAAVNTTRYAIFRCLQHVGLPIERGSGAQTKMNRIEMGLVKTHFYDALCVGESMSLSKEPSIHYSHTWQVTGRGNRQMARVDSFGFPKGHRARKKSCHGFFTGDIIRANVPKGKHAGVHKGRVAIRHSGSFNIRIGEGRMLQGISHKHCKVVQRNTGWMILNRKVEG
jgi:hypothetical protein